MNFYNFKVSRREKSQIINEIKRKLVKKKEILFAFIYGSFHDHSGNLTFRDIDIGVYTKDLDSKRAIYYSLDLSQEFTKSTHFPVEVRVINTAPIPFLFHVIQGELIVNKDDDKCSDFMEDVIRRYLDMKPLLHIASKEAFAA